MHDLVLYHYPRSSCSRKVAWALAAKKLPYSEVIVDLPSGEHKQPQFLEMNPRGEVPVLRVGDRYLRDSAVINEYLEDICPYPPLLPSVPDERARCRWYALLGDRDFYAKVACILREFRKPPESRDHDAIQRTLKQIEEESLSWLECTLAEGGPFLCGERVTLADMAFAPALDNLVRITGLELTNFPRCAEWLRRIQEQPEYPRIAAPNGRAQ